MIIICIYLTLLGLCFMAYPRDPWYVPIVLAGVGLACLIFWWLMLQPLLGIQTGGVLS
jgi:hypothetical protein